MVNINCFNDLIFLNYSNLLTLLTDSDGGSVKTLEGAPLAYGKTDEGFANPYFVARGME